MTKKEKKTILNFIGSQPINYKIILFGCIIVLVVFNILFFESYEVKGRSMTGTIEPGNRVVISKLFKPFYESNDIVVLKKGDILFVKRIYKIAGDTLEFNQKGIFSKNGAIPHDKIYFSILADLNENKRACELYSTLLLRNLDLNRQIKKEVFFDENCRLIVPENYIFVLGDNYFESLDSRFWGLINKNQVLGKVIFPY